MINPYFQTHIQHVPNEVWEISNDTGQYPMVNVYDQHNIMLIPEDIQINTRVITLQFQQAMSGTVILTTQKGLEWASLWSTVEDIEDEKEQKRARGSLRS